MADSVVNLKAAMQQGWRPGGIQDEPVSSPEPDTWWGGFKQQLGRELNLPGMLDAATIRPRDTKLDTLAQFLPYLGTPAPGTTPATQLVKNLFRRTVPAAVQRAASAAPAVEDTVQVLRPPTAPPAAPGFSISPAMTMEEMDAAVAARRAARTPPLRDLTPEVLEPGTTPPAARGQTTGPVSAKHAVALDADVPDFTLADGGEFPLAPIQELVRRTRGPQ